MKRITAPVIGIRQETPTVKTLIFGLENESFEFYAGQYVILEVPYKDKVLKRAYSIASPPTVKDRIELTVKRIKGGKASVYLTSAVKEGDVFSFTGPYGKFYWTEEMGKNLVLIGAGSGIVPLMSILRYIKDKRLRDTEVILLGSFTSYEEIIYRKELFNMGRRAKVNVILTLTREIPPFWKGYVGRFNKSILLRELSKLVNFLYYICGPPAFVNTVKEILQNAGVPATSIKVEKYR